MPDLHLAKVIQSLRSPCSHRLRSLGRASHEMKRTPFQIAVAIEAVDVAGKLLKPADMSGAPPSAEVNVQLTFDGKNGTVGSVNWQADRGSQADEVHRSAHRRGRPNFRRRP